MEILREYDSIKRRVRLITENGFYKVQTRFSLVFKGVHRWTPWVTLKELREDSRGSEGIVLNTYKECIK